MTFYDASRLLSKEAIGGSQLKLFSGVYRAIGGNTAILSPITRNNVIAAKHEFTSFSFISK